MFERYTEESRRTLFFARYEASRHGGVAIESEHMLLALAREANQPIKRILEQLGCQIGDIVKRTDQLTTQKERLSTSVEVPFSSDVKRALRAAADEADALGNQFIAPQHLLLGLFAADGSVATTVLSDAQITAERVRPLVAAMSTGGSPSRSVRDSAIETIKRLVERLAATERTSPEAEELLTRIRLALDEMR